MKPNRIQSHQCDKCGRTFVDGSHGDGIPNGVGFMLDDGRLINLCANCIIKLGKLKEEGKKKFFEDLGIET